MNDRYKDRLKILEDEEIEELYGRPQFNHEERTHFFSLSAEERALADSLLADEMKSDGGLRVEEVLGRSVEAAKAS